MISLLIFAVALIGLLGLSIQALNQVGQSKFRNDASYLAGELLADMWVNAAVNLSTWETRVQSMIPAASTDVYFASCDCVDTGSNACTVGNKKTGTQAIADRQAVTVCISWTDRKDPGAPRRYQTSSMITRN
ncbi:MAG: hypothetical protein M0P39_03745 [Rhodocyclaceae bacterium]|nr:hypothetical protein [Rhodocyclaceae bacterium]